jgi:hypothetical protein
MAGRGLHQPLEHGEAFQHMKAFGLFSLILLVTYLGVAIGQWQEACASRMSKVGFQVTKGMLY